MRWAVLALAVLLAVACSAGSQKEEVVVFAAASLTDAFQEIALLFEGGTVVFNFAGSHQLAGQITQGARADVFASANLDQMEVVAAAGSLSGEITIFATNRLVIAVEPGNPRRLGGLADLARQDLTVVLASGEVPAGRYARLALQSAGVELAPASLEADVRAVVAKVALGEADAGIVYQSDVVAAGESVEGITIADQGPIAYPIATVANGSNREAAQTFIELVLSEGGRAILDRFGFGTP